MLFMTLLALLTMPTVSQEDTVAKAFTHYEAIRVSLAADSTKDVAQHAAELVPLAEKLAGADGKRTAEAVRTAADLKSARDHFGKLSAALLPAFEKAQLNGVEFYTCSMVNQSWAQKGKAIQNPYYGKSMLTCGVPKKK